MEYFVNLLFKMSEAVGLPFDRADIKQGVYFPTAHGDLELDEITIRKGLVKLFSDEFALPVTNRLAEEDFAVQKKIVDGFLGVMAGTATCKVEIVNAVPHNPTVAPPPERKAIEKSADG